ncbi:MAG: hypothetical protein ACFFAU_19560 [Candidatus Hodarchaeota archaeon]
MRYHRKSGLARAVSGLMGILGVLILLAGIFVHSIPFYYALFIAIALWVLSGFVASLLSGGKGRYEFGGKSHYEQPQYNKQESSSYFQSSQDQLNVPPPGMQSFPEQKYCMNCGFAMPSNSVYCPSCGEQME